MFAPVTVAASCWVAPASRIAAWGETETLTGETGVTVTAALADCVASAELVAMTFTWMLLVSPDGAVYKPAGVILPNCGAREDRVQVTPISVEPVTLAANCTVWPECTVMVPGTTATDTAPFWESCEVFSRLQPVLATVNNKARQERDRN